MKFCNINKHVIWLFVMSVHVNYIYFLRWGNWTVKNIYLLHNKHMKNYLWSPLLLTVDYHSVSRWDNQKLYICCSYSLHVKNKYLWHNQAQRIIIFVVLNFSQKGSLLTFSQTTQQWSSCLEYLIIHLPWYEVLTSLTSC